MVDAPRKAAVRSMWAGTITFGLVSIPVELFAAVQSRQTGMKMVDGDGQLLGREYYCPADDQTLSADELVRGLTQQDGTLVVVTDEELESLAPEMTRDIELRRFVPLDQIPGIYFDHPYFLAPSGTSTKAYHLLVAAMKQSGQAGIGTFVMRGHQYLVAILSDRGVLRAETLRFGDEIRTPGDIGLPAPQKADAATEKRFLSVIRSLSKDQPDTGEMADDYAGMLERLALSKKKQGKDVVRLKGDRQEQELDAVSAEVIDLVAILRERMGSRQDAGAKGTEEAAPKSKEAARPRQKAAKSAAKKHAKRTVKSAARKAM